MLLPGLRLRHSLLSPASSGVSRATTPLPVFSRLRPVLPLKQPLPQALMATKSSKWLPLSPACSQVPCPGLPTTRVARAGPFPARQTSLCCLSPASKPSRGSREVNVPSELQMASWRGSAGMGNKLCLEAEGWSLRGARKQF